MRKRNSRKKRNYKVIVKVFYVIILLLVSLFIVRLFSDVNLDDVHPNIQCDEDLFEKADIFYVIPKFEGVNISDNPEWCAKILSYNKTIALHGVYHTYDEFGVDRNESYIQDGANEFNKCFGFYPTRFKAPQTVLSESNRNLLIKMGYKIDSLFTDTFHKVVHCNNQGYYPNWISDLI